MIPVVTSCVTLLGMWLVGRKDWRGWAVGLANQLLWLALIVQTRAWGLLILTVSLVVLYTRALIRWRRDDALIAKLATNTPGEVIPYTAPSVRSVAGLRVGACGCIEGARHHPKCPEYRP